MPNSEWKLSCPECFRSELTKIFDSYYHCENCGSHWPLGSLLELRLLPPTTPRNEAIAVVAKAFASLIVANRLTLLAGDTLYV